MNIPSYVRVAAMLPLVGWACPAAAAGFNSGSTGADGAFAPTANVTVTLPANGILNYTTVDIPSGVTVTFAQTTKAPVVMLATGNVRIAGTLDISGQSSGHAGTTTALCQGGRGGPGGYDGGRGGLPLDLVGGMGGGPGGGGFGTYVGGQCASDVQGGGGGGFSTVGQASGCVRSYGGYAENARTGFGGPAYGAPTMLPLVGGSGGGGGGGSPISSGFCGSGGGGGGGALLLVASGAVELTGNINARGGNGGANANGGCNSSTTYGGNGGGGAGGAVRIVAASYIGGGTINVGGGIAGCNGYSYAGGNGAAGRISIETLSNGTFSPTALPSLAFTSIGGVAVPPNPTGVGDVVLPDTLANPVSVSIAATSIPVGTVVKLVLSQPYGANLTADSSPLAGTYQSSTATASISIPVGSTVLMASTTFTLTVAMGEALSVYAQGERVEGVRLNARVGGGTTATLITVSGKEFAVPHAVLAALGG